MISKKSDESGNTKEEGHDENSSSGKKVNKIEMPTNWQAKGPNIEKIAALASISKFSNTGNFTSDNFQTVKMKNKSQGKNLGRGKMDINPISPISTKSLIKRDIFTSEVKNKA